MFPPNAIDVDKDNNMSGRHHIDETAIRKKIKQAINKAEICKQASTHTFRHSFATQCIPNGMDIRTLQALMGHASVSTTLVYLHVSELKLKAIVSPVDLLSI